MPRFMSFTIACVATVLAVTVSVGFASPDSATAPDSSATRSTIDYTPFLPVLVTTTTLPPPPAGARCSQWWDLAREVGWPESEMWTLDRVMWRESRCRTTSHYKGDPWGGSRGLMQVNGSWTGWLRRGGVLAKVDELFDARTNLIAALRIWKYGMANYDWGWGPWSWQPHKNWSKFFND